MHLPTWIVLSSLIVGFFQIGTVLANDFVPSEELRTLYSDLWVDTVTTKKKRPMIFHFRSDGTYLYKIEGRKRVREWEGRWWVEPPDKLCRNTVKRDRVCFRHKKFGPSYDRYKSTKNRKLRRAWDIRTDSKIAATGFKKLYSNSELESRYKDNLANFNVRNSIDRNIIALLSNFKQAYLNNDGSKLRSLVSRDFTKKEILGSNTISSLNAAQAFDWQTSATKFKAIDFSVKSIKDGERKHFKNVILVASYHGKYFTTRYLEVYSYTNKNGDEKLGQQIRSRLAVASPKMHQVKIFLTDLISKNDLKEALRSTNVDEKLDRLLSNGYKKLPTRQDVSVLFVFREPPRIGSTVRTQIGGWKFQYKIKSSDPYFLVTNEVVMHIDNFKLKLRAFVDNTRVGFRSITD